MSEFAQTEISFCDAMEPLARENHEECAIAPTIVIAEINWKFNFLIRS